jgi:hypothetical protein
LPLAPGTYQVRFFLNDSYTVLAVSALITVAPPTITLSATTVAPGGTVSATIANGPGHSLDWVGLFAVGAPPASYLRAAYLTGTLTPPVPGLTGGTLTFTLPLAPGTYQVRFFLNDSFTVLATSAPITVAASPTVTLSATTVAPGGTVSATIANGPGNSLDWVGLFAVGAPPASYLRAAYLTGTLTPPVPGLTGGTVTFTLPLTPGTYEVRFFLNDSFTVLATSPTVNSGGASLIVLSPQDTSLNLNATNFSTEPLLLTYTWPDNQVANAILMTFDLSGLPAGAVVQQATLQLALVEADGAVEATYIVAAHKIVNANPVIADATGYTADGITPWTANACCSDNVPLAQADISAPYDAPAIDKTIGFKFWTITAMVQEWLSNPAGNRGLLLNSDASKLRDRYRNFASDDHPDSNVRPSLRVTYTLGP